MHKSFKLVKKNHKKKEKKEKKKKEEKKISFQEIYSHKTSKNIRISKLYQFPSQEFNKFLICEHLSNYKKMFQNEEKCDFVIYAGKTNQKIFCHQLILNASSRFFYEKHHENPDSNELYLAKFEFDIVEPIISFFYDSQFNFDLKKFEKYFQLAKYFKLTSLTIKIEKEVSEKVNTTNTIVIYFKSIKIESTYLSNFCENFMKENIDKIIQEDQTGEITDNELKKIIEIIQSTSKDKRIDMIWKLAKDWKAKFEKNKPNLLDKDKYVDPIQIQEMKNEVDNFYFVIDNIKNSRKISFDLKTQKNPILPSTHQLELMNQNNQNLQKQIEKLENNNKIQDEKIKAQSKKLNEQEKEIQEKENQIKQLEIMLENLQPEKKAIKELQNFQNETKLNQKSFEDTIKYMLQFPQNQEIQENSCLILEKFGKENQNSDIGNEFTKAIQPLLNAMSNFSNNSDIQTKASSVLLTFSGDLERDKLEKRKLQGIQIAKFHGIQLLINAINNFPNNILIQEKSISNLINIAIDSENQNEIRKQGGIETIIKAMNDSKDKKVIQEKGCWALLNLSFNDQNQNEIKEKKGIETIIKTMTNFPKKKGIQEKACGALLNLSVNDQNQNEIKEKKGIETIIKAMTNFPNNQDIQEHACGILLNLSLNKKNQNEIREKMGIEIIIKTMINFPKNQDIQEKGCGALFNLSSNKSNKKEIKRLNGISILQSSLQNFPNNSKFKIANKKSSWTFKLIKN
ncbi:protein aardvark [Anaeramoeba ignava]|uniref:Protein aardvark n=1 Tax=Anaeramoeba ignava TaxID=1746090 RepID=A0A9Q0LGM1_ANAIG|nr:protein aardvark [Anaeramoeba ignava]